MRSTALVLFAAVVAALVAIGTPAFAQIVHVGSVTRTGGKAHTDACPLCISKTDCASPDKFTIPYTIDDLSGIDSLEIWVTDTQGDCSLYTSRTGSDAQCFRVVTEDIPAKSDSLVVNADTIANALPDIANCTDASGDSSGRDVVFFLMAFRSAGGDIPADDLDKTLTITVDLVGPPAPTSLEFLGGDSVGIINISGTLDEDVAHLQMFCNPDVNADTNAGGGSSTQSRTQGGVAGAPNFGGAGGLGGAGGAGGGVAGGGANLGGGGSGGASNGGTGGTGGSTSSAGGDGAGGSPNLSCETGSLKEGEVPPSENASSDVVGDRTTRQVLSYALDNTQVYACGLAAVDELGNVGPLSEVQCINPQPVDDFFEVYRNAGGQGGCVGGCAIAPDHLGLWPFLGAGALMALLLRRRRVGRGKTTLLVGLIVGAGVLGAASLAHAEVPDNNWRQTSRPQSEQPNTPFYFEVRFAPYWPAVDQEPGLSGTPYKDTFTNDPLFYFGLEFDVTPFRIPYIGVIGAGVGWGYTWASAHPKLSNCTDTTNPDNCISQGDTTSLSIMPMNVSLVLRADEIMRRTVVPLVPYAKIGFGFAYWSAANTTGGSVIQQPGDDLYGEDVTIGMHIALGLALALNFIDGRAPMAMRETTGVGHIYLFAEWMDALLNGFGGGQMYVGTNTIVAGLAADF